MYKRQDEAIVVPHKVHYTIPEYPRVIEREVGECQGNRTKLLNELASSDNMGIGPADLVHINFTDKSHKTEFGQFFYITGLDIGSKDVPKQFITSLKENIKETLKKDMNVIVTYCCVNMFSNIDIRIRCDVDGSFQFNAVDCINSTTNDQLDDQLWDEIFVSCCIRSLIMNTDLERKFPGLVEYPLAFESGGLISCQNLVTKLCKFLPRCLESGWDLSKSIHPTILHNYLMESLLLFLNIIPGKLIEFTLDLLDSLMAEDSENELYYNIAKIAVMEQDGEMESQMIVALNQTLNLLLPAIDKLAPRDIDSFQLLNCVSSLLNLQAKFLNNRKDFELSLAVCKISTELSLDSFDSWYYLAKAYVEVGKFKEALTAINSMPHLLPVDRSKQAMIQNFMSRDYYKKPLSDSNPACDLTPQELHSLGNTMKQFKEKELRRMTFGRIVMVNNSKRGYMEDIWEESCLDFGPIYGCLLYTSRCV